MENWKETSKEPPPQKKIVKTKIDDNDGIRNEANLFLSGNLWFMEDGKMYVYYKPTHWKFI